MRQHVPYHPGISEESSRFFSLLARIIRVILSEVKNPAFLRYALARFVTSLRMTERTPSEHIMSNPGYAAQR